MLIYDNLEQGSPEWLKLRLGVPTTSSFGKIITPAGKRSGQFTGYVNECLAELITGESEPFFQTRAMERGTELEPEAREYYEVSEGMRVKEVGFVTSRDGRVGCSPDGFVGRKGLVEIKCPGQRKHTENLISGEIDKQYIPQVQGQLFMTSREWCDWISYFPGMPASIVRVLPDEDYQATLLELLREFLLEMDHKIEILREKGVIFKAEVKPIEKTKVEDDQKEDATAA